MNKSRIFVSVFLSILMLLPLCITASAFDFSMSGESSFEVPGAVCAEYSVTSGENGNTLLCQTLSFSPSDGCIPMAFSAYAGTSGTLETQYNVAVSKYGYDVVGVINGAYATMDPGGVYGNYGTLNGISVSNGKIASAHSGYSGSVVAFGSDGSMNVVDSRLEYRLLIGGREVVNGLYYINKTSGSKLASNWSDGFYYYDTSCGKKADTYEICPGYEIVCRKSANNDLIIGDVLFGNVVEVRENAYGGILADDYVTCSDLFILFVKSDSSNAEYARNVKENDKVCISVCETVEASREIMENANSVITNVGWLVKDGVDRTQIDSTVGTHSVTAQARWTALGTKPDGSFVFFTSEGKATGTDGSLTLRDVAKAMIELGCSNVLRFDGGGSSAMYLADTGSGSAGYAQSSTRPVGDCILVVRRSSLADNNAVQRVSEAYITLGNAYVSDPTYTRFSEAQQGCDDILASASRVSGDLRRVLASATNTLLLRESVVEASSRTDVSPFDYCGYVYTAYTEKCGDAETLIASGGSDNITMFYTAADILSLYYMTGDMTVSVTDGKSYTRSSPTRGDQWDDDGKRLTDGVKDENGETTAYSGWDTRSTGTGDVEVTVSLGERTEGIDTFSAFLASCSSWGIPVPTRVSVSVSDDGSNFVSVGSASVTAASQSASGEWVMREYTLSLSKAVSASYIRFSLYSGSHLWVCEVSATASYNKLVRGDVSGDGKIDSVDYIMLKRTVLGTYIPSVYGNICADINGSGALDGIDYIMLKRVVLGTYTI